MTKVAAAAVMDLMVVVAVDQGMDDRPHWPLVGEQAWVYYSHTLPPTSQKGYLEYAENCECGN